MSSANRTIKACSTAPLRSMTSRTSNSTAPGLSETVGPISSGQTKKTSSASSSNLAGSSRFRTSPESSGRVSQPGPHMRSVGSSSTGAGSASGVANGSSKIGHTNGHVPSSSSIDPMRLSQSGLWTLRQVTFRIYLGWTEAEIAGYFGESTKWVRQRRARLREELSA
jgi:hypothetical protein